MGKKRAKPADPEREKQKQALKERLKARPEQMDTFAGYCGGNYQLKNDADSVKCEAFNEVAAETQYLNAAEQELRGPELSDEKEPQSAGMEEDSETLNNDAEEETSSDVDMDDINYWATEIGAVVALSEALMQSSNPELQDKALKVFNAAQGTLKVLGKLSDGLSLGTSVLSALKARANHQGEFTAYWNLGRDLGLLGITVLCGPLGLTLSTLNAFMVAFDPNWFAKVMKNPQGPLAGKIIKWADSQKKNGAEIPSLEDTQSRRQAISESFKNANPF